MSEQHAAAQTIAHQQHQIDTLAKAAREAFHTIRDMGATAESLEEVRGEEADAELRQDWWFGNFGRNLTSMEGDAFIEWPDLALARDNLEKALAVLT